MGFAFLETSVQAHGYLQTKSARNRSASGDDL